MLDLDAEQRDVTNKRSPLSRLQRTGIRTLRDAVIMREDVFRIYDLRLVSEEFRYRVQTAVPEIPVYTLEQQAPDAPILSDGERAAQYCNSLKQVPLQLISSGRRNPEMHEKPVTMADIIDPDTNEPYARRGYGDARIRGVPTWYTEREHQAAVEFVRDFRATRRKLYGEE